MATVTVVWAELREKRVLKTTTTIWGEKATVFKQKDLLIEDKKKLSQSD